MDDKNLISFEDTSVAFASKSDKELRRMYLLFSAMNWKQLTKIGTNFVKTAFEIRFPIKRIIKNTLFKQFCGGETIEECGKTIKELQQYNITTIPDYSVEGDSHEANYLNTAREIDKLITLDAESNAISFTVFKVSGIASAEILQKIQLGESLSLEENQIFDKIKERLEHLCKNAWKNNVRLLIDAEESWIQGTIDALVLAMMSKYNKETAIVYNTFQMYRADMLDSLKEAYDLAITDRFFLGVKLVRGAYMEKENLRAKELGYKSPIYATKAETDIAFNEAIDFCVGNIQMTHLCLGTHNEESTKLLVELMHKKHIPVDDERIYFSQLYGMGDHISYNLAKAGYNVAKYLPFGPVEAVMPYLFRRAQENKAMTGQTSRELMLIKQELKKRKQLREGQLSPSA
ncbi:MAG TPA: proline dehydrogenase family protein [Cytophagaceae bacterium]|jgi:proline dehydrogenase